MVLSLVSSTAPASRLCSSASVLSIRLRQIGQSAPRLLEVQELHISYRHPACNLHLGIVGGLPIPRPGGLLLCTISRVRSGSVSKYDRCVPPFWEASSNSKQQETIAVFIDKDDHLDRREAGQTCIFITTSTTPADVIFAHAAGRRCAQIFATDTDEVPSSLAARLHHVLFLTLAHRENQRPTEVAPGFSIRVVNVNQ